MDSFKDREQNFEKKFAHDEELQFKVNARRNKYLGQWVSQILSYDSEKEKEYIHSVIKADFEEAGDEDVFRKLKVDLKKGDMLVYSGCELEHWRNKFKGKEHIQVFLHYNNRKTPGAKENIFDKRPHLGLPSWFKR